ncbi:MAG: CDP-alcohol phosphatidyltransferase family protein [Propionibacteriaceae bacterium]|jgi:CDP-diacylglycerol--serine O-phosphatidyltransferase|nr:CDP-alcohol phosphatidyltransferase family protein [Propionibacteriaceae bacterium]
MIGVFHVSNTITYLGVAAAVTGLVLAADRPGWAVLCLVVAGVCDLFDGVFARRFPRSDAVRQFGIQLDSLADMVSFVALPLAVMMATRPPWWLALVVGVGYAWAAVTRLAFFNITTDGLPAAYRGVPVTYAALLLPLVWLVVELLNGSTRLAWTISLALLGLSFVIDVSVPKPRGRAYAGFALLAIVLLAGLAWLELS